MNRRVFSLAILTMISAFILIMVIVYATNADKINRLFGWEKEKQEAVTEEASEKETATETVYGDQIGDNLSGFLLDEDFFDENEKIPSVVVIRQASGAQDQTDETTGELIGDDGIKGDADAQEPQDHPSGTGMAVVGELTNPNPDLPAGFQDDATGASGYLTTVPQAPAGGFGQYIPADQTISGTPVGTP
jgi:hypothetical protein